MSSTSPGPSELKGICGLCVYGEDCELARGSTAPPLNCAQFEPFPVEVREEAKVTSVRATQQKPDAASEKHLGLCRNCIHRDDCTYPRNEGGVWRCEEYE